MNLLRSLVTYKSMGWAALQSCSLSSLKGCGDQDRFPIIGEMHMLHPSPKRKERQCGDYRLASKHHFYHKENHRASSLGSCLCEQEGEDGECELA